MSSEKSNPPKNSSRLAQILDAAAEVLGREGAAGLNHRAVDRQAELPEGSTSNRFRTRAALVAAVCKHLTDRDLAQIQRIASGVDYASESALKNAASVLTDIVWNWSEENAASTRARFELYLIALRTPDIAAQLVEARAEFRKTIADWMERIAPGASDHMEGLLAFVEGLTVTQALHPANRMPREKLQAEIETFLAALAMRKQQ